MSITYCSLKKIRWRHIFCGEYKIIVNHNVCSDSYPIPNVDVAIHSLAGINVFTKIDMKTAYYQIQIDNNFKEVTTIIRQ